MAPSIKELRHYLLEIEDKVDELLLVRMQLMNENQRLLEAYTELEKKYNEEKKRYQELAEREKEVKMHAALSGNPEHNRLMKTHLNRLIKEVEYCISELEKSGL